MASRVVCPARGRDGVPADSAGVGVTEPPLDLVVGTAGLAADRLEARDLLPEAGQRRLMAGCWIVVGQARVGELVDRRLVGDAERVLEAG